MSRRNCWTCRHSGPKADDCDRLTLDEVVDAPIFDWLDAALMADDGTVPEDSDGCPAWEATSPPTPAPAWPDPEEVWGAPDIMTEGSRRIWLDTPTERAMLTVDPEAIGPAVVAEAGDLTVTLDCDPADIPEAVARVTAAILAAVTAVPGGA